MLSRKERKEEISRRIENERNKNKYYERTEEATLENKQ